MTKQDLADRSGVSISFLSDLTTGKANPSLKVMESIAAALDVPLPYLLESSDLDDETLNSISENHFLKSLPPGYERVSVVLTKQKAFIVKQWAEDTKKELLKENQKKH